MKTCVFCGTTNDDSADVCSVCGGALPDSGYSSGSAGRKKSGAGSKVWLIVLGAVLACAAVVLLIFVLSPKLSLARSSKETFQLLPRAIEAKSDVVFSKQLTKKVSDGKFSAQLEWSNATATVATDFAYSRPRKIISGTARIADSQSNLDLSLRYSVDKNIVEVSFAENGFNVYGFKRKDFAEKYGNSMVSTLASNMPESSGLSVLQKQPVASDFSTQFKKTCNAFLKSVEVERLGKTTIYINDAARECRAYKLKWGEEAAKKFTDFLSSNGLSTVLSEKLIPIISKIEPECICYVDKNGKLAGVDFVYIGQQCSFALAGESNPWDSFTLKVGSVYGGTVIYSGGIVRDGNMLYISLENGTDVLFQLAYNTSTGEYVLNTKNYSELLRGQFLSSSGKFTFAVYFDDAGDTSCLKLTVSELDAKPERLAKKYIDILDMSLSDWQRLLLDIGVRLA